MILKKPVNLKNFIVNKYDFFFGRTFDRTFLNARRRYFIFSVFTLFLKVQVILKLWYNFEEEKGRYKNVHTIAPVIIKKIVKKYDDILLIYFNQVVYFWYSNYNRPWYFMYNAENGF